MKKSAFLILLTLLITTFKASEAAPPSQEGVRAVITSPTDNAVVRGVVNIYGSATHPDFLFYKVEYGREPKPEQWILIGSLHEEQVLDGLLETWDTTIVPDGSYSLRLSVVRRDYNYIEYFVRGISVANLKPTETPTPTITPTPPAIPTPLPPTPTVFIEQPPTPTPRPSPTPTRIGGEERESPLPFRSFGLAFCYGGGAAVGLFALLGTLNIVRRFISWLISLLFSPR